LKFLTGFEVHSVIGLLKGGNSSSQLTNIGMLYGKQFEVAQAQIIENNISGGDIMLLFENRKARGQTLLCSLP
jgi:hypothetical protein